MVDTRFFSLPASLSLAALAAKTGAQLADESHGDFIVNDVAALSDAQEGQIAFFDNKKYKAQFETTNASACYVHPDMARFAPAGVRLLLSKAPYKSYALAAQCLYPEKRPAIGIAPSAFIHETAVIGCDVVIQHGCVIEENAVIGDGTWIEPNAFIGAGVILGKNCRVGHAASVTHAIIADHVRLYPGVRVGQDGFGFAIDPQGYVKVPQLGRVIIEDHVEIGANTTIDRGALGDTVIGRGTWIDNLVQIAHNVKIGKGCILVAQSGVAGSTVLEDYVVLGGQVGIAGHLKIGTQVRVAAQSGVMRDLPAKTEWMGYPAQPIRQFMRQIATLGRMAGSKKPSVLDE